MFRKLVLILLVLGVMLSPVQLEARNGKASKGKSQLVNRMLVGKGWQSDSIPVINRSSYDRSAIEYAAQQWATTLAPRLSVQHQSPTLCSDVNPIKNTIILCDAAPWTGPSNAGIAAFTANYTQVKKKRGKKSNNVAIQGTVIWLYQPRWSDEKIIRYIPTHEFGHALGLDEMNCACVMTPFVSDIDYLGPEATAAVNAIYS